MGFVQRRLVKFVMGVVTYPKVTVAVCAVLLVVAVAFAWFHLRLSTDQDELLTPRLKFFKDYKDFTGKFPENEAFYCILEPQDWGKVPVAKRWMAFADRLTGELMGLTGDVRKVQARVPLEALGDQGLMFEEWEGVKAASAEAKGFGQLARVIGEAPGIESLVLGRNMLVRLYGALGRGPAKDAAGMAEVVTRAAAGAIATPVGEWKKGAEIPDLTDLDPRARVDPSRYGYSMIRDETKRGTPAYAAEKILVISIYTERDYSSLADVTEPLARMRAVVKRVAGEFPEFREPVITGRPALEADEMATSDRDTRFAEIAGLSVVFVVMFIFLRNLWLVIVAEVCLGVGIGWTFGWAAMSVGRLNLLSLVFVIALIGIGMDYLIQILTRYRFEKRRYTRPQAVWARVFRYVSAPISTACLGAAGAFLVALLTDFQGAAELGLIAGGGLLLCLAAGYTLLPALLTLFPARVGEVAAGGRYAAGAAPAAGGWRLLPAVVWGVVAVGGLWLAFPPTFDANLLKLQADGLASVREVRKLPAWYAVVLSEDLGKLKAARAALMPAVGEATTIDGAKTESVLEAMEKQAWLAENNRGVTQIQWVEPAAPTVAELQGIGDAAEGMVSAWKRQAGAGELSGVEGAVAELRRALQMAGVAQEEKVARVGAWQRAFLGEVKANLAQFEPGALEVGRLPEQLRGHLVYLPEGKGGRATYALYVYPKGDLWESGKLAAFVGEVEQRMAPVEAGGGVVLTGIAPQLYHSTQMIHRAFLVSTLYALGLVFVLVLLDLRKLGQTLLAISVLGLGLPMLLLAMYLWRVWLGEPWGISGSWNFANFFGLPILIGAGHEYGVFMVHRYRETLHDPRRVWRAWDVSDRALLLCGIVTSASFGFLVFAQHHGLASLGWVMGVGTACIYLATVVVLRPVLQWRLKRKGVYGGE